VKTIRFKPNSFLASVCPKGIDIGSFYFYMKASIVDMKKGDPTKHEPKNVHKRPWS
jgi:hypothetical protein